MFSLKDTMVNVKEICGLPQVKWFICQATISIRKMSMFSLYMVQKKISFCDPEMKEYCIVNLWNLFNSTFLKKVSHYSIF